MGLLAVHLVVLGSNCLEVAAHLVVHLEVHLVVHLVVRWVLLVVRWVLLVVLDSTGLEEH